ncbi:MAG: hypothetical protein MUE52_15375 [Tabrizicola sp.]|jgi:hypothetical protein|nr:hypothetical protein [Tabrizicola sp.]
MRTLLSSLRVGLALLGGFAILVLAAGGLLRWASSGPDNRPPTPTDVALLASDMHVSFGGVSLTLPLVAFRERSERTAFLSDHSEEEFGRRAARRVAFADSAGNPATPLPLENAAIWIEAFGLEDVDGAAWRLICDQLARHWSRSVCADPFAPLLQSLPRGWFTLADARHLDAFAGTHIFAGGLGNAAPLLQSMPLIQGEPLLLCGVPHKPGAPRPCLAALRIAGDLVAVWFVQDGPAEPVLAQARREGQAITALVTHGFGAVEDYPALIAATCATLRPGAKPLRPGDGDWPC